MTLSWDSANDGGMTLTNNALTISSDGLSGSNPYNAIANQSFTTGKLYFELTIVELGTATGFGGDEIGIGCAQGWMGLPGSGWVGQGGGSVWAPKGDTIIGGGTDTAFTGPLVAGDVIGVAVDYDGPNIDFYLNGVESSAGTTHMFMSPNTTMFPAISLMPGNKATINFGGSAFAHPIPTGFSAYPGASIASISLSPGTVVAGSGIQPITVTGTNTAFSGADDFTVQGGAFAFFQGQTIVSDTSAILNYSPGIVTDPVVFTDTNSNSQASLSIVAPDLGPIVIGCIGDSITAGVNSNPVTDMENYLNTLGYTATCLNQGHGGSTTASWASTDTDNFLDTALAAFTTAGATIVSIMLGTNDAQTFFNITPEQHLANMHIIVGRCLAAGFKVIFHKPLYTAPNANPWPLDPSTLYDEYWSIDQGLVDGVNVFAGDTSNFAATLQNPGLLSGSDGVHPGGDGTGIIIGTNWATAVAHKVGRQARWAHS